MITTLKLKISQGIKKCHDYETIVIVGVSNYIIIDVVVNLFIIVCLLFRCS